MVKPSAQSGNDRRSDGAKSGLVRRDLILGAAAGMILPGVAPVAVRADDPFSGNPFRDRFQTFRRTFRVEPDRAEAERIKNVIIAGRTPREGLVEIVAPDIAENGAAVPVTMRVNCAMTADDYPDVLHLMAMENPFPEIAKYHLSPANGEAEVVMRCRMRATAPLVAIAVMIDGSIGVAEKVVNVTLGACS